MPVVADLTALQDQLAARFSNAHVVVAMSGGVDSSVAALLLKRAGVRVSAVFMKNWNEPGGDGACAWEADVADAMDVCDTLDIAINTVDLSRDYWDSVFAEFLEGYRQGYTPNPDILCNREIKFKVFLEHARDLGGDVIATGHYARIMTADGAYTLAKGADPNKDQSYFLYTLGQAQLARIVFPIGGTTKDRVRQVARGAGLNTHDKKDSTGICFIGEHRFKDFMGRYIPARPGSIKTTSGVVIGEHDGIAYYTIGQRQGLGIGGVKGAAEAPWFVVEKDASSNELIVAQGHDHPALMHTGLTANSLSWVAGDAPGATFACNAKTRYRQSDQPCTVSRLGADSVEITFERPQRALTRGQSVVLYDAERCLGGGIIDSVF